MERESSRSTRAFQYCILVSSATSCFCLLHLYFLATIPLYGAVLLSMSIIPTWGLHGYLSSSFSGKKQRHTQRPGCGVLFIVFSLGIGVMATFAASVFSANTFLYFVGFPQWLITSEMREVLLLYLLIMVIGITILHTVIPHWVGVFIYRAKKETREEAQKRYLDASIEWP